MWLRLLLPRRGGGRGLRGLSRVRRTALLASGAASVVLILAGCGNSSSTGADKPHRTRAHTATTRTVRTVKPAPPPSAAEIVRAAQLTGQKPGYQARLHVRIRVPQFGDPATAFGVGSFDPSSNSGTLNLVVNPPGLLYIMGPIPTRAVIVGDRLYVRVPADDGSLVGISSRWLEGSVSALGLADTVNPAVVLAQTARDATQRVPGQRAHVTIDPATGLVRSLVLAFYDPAIHAHIRVALRFTGFAPVSPAQAPPADQVGDLPSALQRVGA